MQRLLALARACFWGCLFLVEMNTCVRTRKPRDGWFHMSSWLDFDARSPPQDRVLRALILQHSSALTKRGWKAGNTPAAPHTSAWAAVHRRHPSSGLRGAAPPLSARCRGAVPPLNTEYPRRWKREDGCKNLVLLGKGAEFCICN